MIATCLIRQEPNYGHEQFAAGLAACGYTVRYNPSHDPRPGDILLTWNRIGSRNAIAGIYERKGYPVIVVENGWIAPAGGKLYALCLGHHNGAGWWPVGTGSRFPQLNIELKPWRKAGQKLVVLASRGIGEPGVAQPREWLGAVLSALKRRTKRPVELRPHPGDSHADISESLVDAHAVVTWASGAAVKAIAAGVPAFYELPRWVGALAARPLSHDLEDPFLGDRMPMFERLSWASWTAAEIESGAAFRWLLQI